LTPGERDLAMVFQHYALYPHMSVRENMAFGLRNRRAPKQEIASRIARAAAILEIDDYLDRTPGQLSGGQRQRVAIGRAIVKQPRLFLFDEPLSNLDASLRSRTRLELAKLRTRVEAAMVIVTHDQVEAMTLADRVVLLHERRLQQVGSPMEIYARPANLFVAGFVGSPRMAFLPVAVEVGDQGEAVARLGDATRVATKVQAADLPPDRRLQIGLRAHQVALAPCEESDAQARVDMVERLGERTLVYARLHDGSELIAEAPGDSRVNAGDVIGLRIDAARAPLFDAAGRAYHGRDS
jgi:multiple sugar transport system ATP-binding protein